MAKSKTATKATVGFSPKKKIKTEMSDTPFSDKPNVVRIVPMRGGFYEVVIIEDGNNSRDDGFFPYMFGLVKDNNGQYTRDGKVMIRSTAAQDINIIGAFPRRKSLQDDSIMKNQTGVVTSEGTKMYYNR